MLVATAGSGATTTQLTVNFTPTSVAFTQDYALKYKTFDGAYADANTATINVTKGSAALVATTGITSGLTTPIASGEVTYRVNGIDSYGFYLETVKAFTF
jgi:hypothetical protein